VTPYHSEGGLTIYHGDARDVLASVTSKALMVTDPPYNVGYHYDEHHDQLPDKEYWEWMLSVVRRPLVFLHYPEAVITLARKMRRSPEKVVAWVYHANTPKQWRSIAWFGVTPDLSLDGQPYKNPTDSRVQKLIAAGKMARLYDWWQIEQVKNVSREKTSHPCQIPVSLMTRILNVTPLPETVVDPFMGSGSTLVAAQRLGRTAIGIEKSEAYCEIAAKRLQQSALPLEFTA
jgi:DNA modification methylase